MSNGDVIFTFQYDPWLIATTLEIIENCLDENREIEWLDLVSRSRNSIPLRPSKVLNLIDYRVKLGRSKTKIRGLVVRRIGYPINETVGRIINDSHTNSLLDLAIEVAKLELISRLREANPDFSRNRLRVQRLSTLFLETYYEGFQYLKYHNPRFVYLFNGRFVQERAVWEACKNLGIKVIFFEKFNMDWHDRYFLFHEPVHSTKYRSKLMLETELTIGEESVSSDLEVAISWFENRISGSTQKFTKNQNEFNLESIPKPYYVFFSSSEDELISSDLISKTWGDQLSAVKKLINVVMLLDGDHLIIRLHPNLKTKSIHEQNQWKLMTRYLEENCPRVRVLGPHSRINSYALIRESKGVVTVGSTIGVEAAYLGKKSVLIGRAFHEHMGITINPQSEDDLRKTLEKESDVLDTRHVIKACLKYSWFQESGGERFKHIRYIQQKRRSHYRYGHLRLRQSLLGLSVSRLEEVMKRAWLWAKALHLKPN